MKKPSITYDDFLKLDLIVGQVMNASPVENSKKLLELSIDLGTEYGIVTVLTGMAQYYKPDDFLTKKFIFLANLEPRAMAGKTSQGMLLSADVEGRPILSPLDSSIANGTIIR